MVWLFSVSELETEQWYLWYPWVWSCHEHKQWFTWTRWTLGALWWFLSSLLQITTLITESYLHAIRIFSLPHKSTSRCHFTGVWQSKNRVVFGRAVYECAEGGPSYTLLWQKAFLMIYEAHIHIFYVSLFFVRRHSGREIRFQFSHLTEMWD